MERKLRRTASWRWSSWISLWKFRVVKCGQRNLEYSVKASQEEDNNGMIRFDMKFPLLTPLDCPRKIWFDQPSCKRRANPCRKNVEVSRSQRNQPARWISAF